MSEFFLELFSEEVPPKLQTNARKELFFELNNFFEEYNYELVAQRLALRRSAARCASLILRALPLTSNWEFPIGNYWQNF